MNKRALLVDDSLLDVALTLRAVQECGLADICETASDGAEACDLISRSHFDLLLIDIKMPRVDGLEFLAHLNARPHFRTPVIVVSGSDLATDRSRALELGAVEYVHKALEFSQFKASLQAALRRHGFC